MKDHEIVALLSNVNIDPVIQIMSSEMNCVPSEGYGNIWGTVMSSASGFNNLNPDIIVFIVDIEQMMERAVDYSEAYGIVDEWFEMLDNNIHDDKEYYVSDVIFRSEMIAENDSFFESTIVDYWMKALQKRVIGYTNVHPLMLGREISRLGKEKFFSKKMWYLGKIPYTNEGAHIVADTTKTVLKLMTRPTKKVLALDLDNTIWGGVLGENGVEGIELSDNNIGAVYKKVQRYIRSIKNTGVLLVVVSKNNESDVMELWDRHPHMLLKREDFVLTKINWNDKAENIREIAEELNLGLDAVVFIDDMASERDNIRQRLPDVVVPEFPDRVEDYPDFIFEVYEKYFKKTRLTEEDRAKTIQYTENAARVESAKGISYEEFLESLHLVVKKVELDDIRLERVAQLHAKTNQFNLTTKRYTKSEIYSLMKNGYKVYAYRVNDRFGDYGIVAAAIVDCEKPEIISLLLSCRIMGKLIENYIINDIERDMIAMGHTTLRSKYIRTKKNKVVEKLFDSLGYSVVSRTENETEYQVDLVKRLERKYFVYSL